MSGATTSSDEAGAQIAQECVSLYRKFFLEDYLLLEAFAFRTKKFIVIPEKRGAWMAAFDTSVAHPSLKAIERKNERQIVELSDFEPLFEKAALNFVEQQKIETFAQKDQSGMGTRLAERVRSYDPTCNRVVWISFTNVVKKGPTRVFISEIAGSKTRQGAIDSLQKSFSYPAIVVVESPLLQLEKMYDETSPMDRFEMRVYLGKMGVRARFDPHDEHAMESGRVWMDEVRAGLRFCSLCGLTGSKESAPDARKACSECKISRYCTRECQTMDWGVHKRHCKIIALAAKIWTAQGDAVGSSSSSSSST